MGFNAQYSDIPTPRFGEYLGLRLQNSNARSVPGERVEP